MGITSTFKTFAKTASQNAGSAAKIAADRARVLAKAAADKAKVASEQAKIAAAKSAAFVKANPKTTLAVGLGVTGGAVFTGVTVDKINKGDNLGEAIQGTIVDTAGVVVGSASGVAKTGVSAVVDVAKTGVSAVVDVAGEVVSSIFPNLGAYLPFIGIILLILLGLYAKFKLKLF